MTGSVEFTDADADPLTYTASAPASGSIVVHPDGSFSYSPTATARHGAAADGASGSDLVDMFTVTAGDGNGGATPVEVMVPIGAANVAPTLVSTTANTPEPDSGVVTGTVVFSDPDGDTPTYTGTGDTAKGSVVVHTDGSFTYTPTMNLSAGEHYMQVSKWLGHSTFVLTLTTYADYINEDEQAAPKVGRGVASIDANVVAIYG